MERLENTAFWKKEIESVCFRQMKGGELVALLDCDLESVDPDILDVIRHRIVMLALPKLRYWSAKARLVPAESVLAQCVTELAAILRRPTSAKFSALVIDFGCTGPKSIAATAEAEVEWQAGLRRLPDTKEGPKPYRPMGLREVPWPPIALQDLADQQQSETPESNSRLDILARLDDATRKRFADAIRIVELLETTPMNFQDVAEELGVSKRTVRRRLEELGAHLDYRRSTTKNAAE